MSCDNVKIHNFKCNRHGDTTFKKIFVFQQATAQTELVLKIKGSFGQKTVSTGSGLTRIHEKTWRWDQHKEDLVAGTYNYILCYVNGDVERTIATGKLEILNHL